MASVQYPPLRILSPFFTAAPVRSRVSRVADGLIFGFGRYSTNKAPCPAGALLGGQSAVGFM